MDKVKDGDQFDYVAGYGKLMDIISTELQRRALIRDRQAAARRPDQVFKNTMRELGMNPNGTNITPSVPGPIKPKDDRKGADAKKKAEDKKKADDKKKAERDKIKADKKKKWEEGQKKKGDKDKGKDPKKDKKD